MSLLNLSSPPLSINVSLPQPPPGLQYDTTATLAGVLVPRVRLGVGGEGLSVVLGEFDDFVAGLKKGG